MLLTRHATIEGPRWALDGKLLPPDFSLGLLLALPAAKSAALLQAAAGDEEARGPLLAPIEKDQEVWACGVTYLRSREARMAESEDSADVYDKVYRAERPELFFKAVGRRVVGPGGAVRIRRDSSWNVPEPELTLVVNSRMEIVGYTVGNDMSSRDIEGENPLYLPQAKIYNGACSLGPAIRLAPADALREVAIELQIRRDGSEVFRGSTNSSKMKRGLEELASWLGCELDFPQGAFLLTGAGIVPPGEFTLAAGDELRISIGELVLENSVAAEDR